MKRRYCDDSVALIGELPSERCAVNLRLCGRNGGDARILVKDFKDHEKVYFVIDVSAFSDVHYTCPFAVAEFLHSVYTYFNLAHH